LHAGRHTGHPYLDELTLHTPLIIPAGLTLDLQLTLTTTDPARQTLSIHTRPHPNDTDTDTDNTDDADDTDRAGWTSQATGLLTNDPPPAPTGWDGAWPPPQATPLPVTGLYEQLDELGLHYGPVFQGLHAAWRDQDSLYAEVSLPTDDQHAFSLHPALLDAALHPIAVTTDPATAQVRLPFTFTGVRLHAPHPHTLRARLTLTGEPGQRTGARVRVDLYDPANTPVATITALSLRPLPATGQATAGRQHLYTLHWPILTPSSD